MRFVMGNRNSIPGFAGRRQRRKGRHALCMSMTQLKKRCFKWMKQDTDVPGCCFRNVNHNVFMINMGTYEPIKAPANLIYYWKTTNFRRRGAACSEPFLTLNQFSKHQQTGPRGVVWHERVYERIESPGSSQLIFMIRLIRLYCSGVTPVVSV